MKEGKAISDAVIRRLPRYYRCLGELAERGVTRVSSLEMARLLGLTASQVRQDLNNFGGFGQQGYGYDAAYLRRQIEAIMGLTREYTMVVLGVGNIGRALTNYSGFAAAGFFVRAAFDVSISEEYEEGGVLYGGMDKFPAYAGSNRIDIAAIAVPKAHAQGVADLAVGLGVKAIWNFAPIDLECPPDVAVESINMSESLYMLSYRFNHRGEN